MKLQIRVDDESGKIVDACFKTFGCDSEIASSSVATEWVKGKKMEEVLSIKNTYFGVELKEVKLKEGYYIIDPAKAVEMVDENTICGDVILSSILTGEFEDVKLLN